MAYDKLLKEWPKQRSISGLWDREDVIWFLDNYWKDGWWKVFEPSHHVLKSAQMAGIDCLEILRTYNYLKETERHG